MAAVFTSIGYPGTIEPGIDWARTHASAGGTYGVLGAGDWKVSIKPAADRTAQIAAGGGFGGGIVDTTVGVGEVVFGTLTSGVRYDMVVVHRTGAASTFTVIAGSSTRGLPTRTFTPGTSDDQPIALARITGGVGGGTLDQIIDLRCWQANGGAVGADDLVRSYLTDVGTLVRIGADQWQRTLDVFGSPTWVKVVQTAVLTAADPAEANAASLGATLRSAGTLITLTEGTWLVTGSASVMTLDAADYATAILADTVGEVTGSRGMGAGTQPLGGSVPGVALHTRPVRITLAAGATRQIQVAVRPNGSSTLRLASFAASPVAWIDAQRIA